MGALSDRRARRRCQVVRAVAAVLLICLVTYLILGHWPEVLLCVFSP
jgi:hypothetical protein